MWYIWFAWIVFKYVFFLPVDTLLIDYQFTFSLSQEDDRYYTAINFVATPDEVRISFKLSYFVLNFVWVFYLGHPGQKYYIVAE